MLRPSLDVFSCFHPSHTTNQQNEEMWKAIKKEILGEDDEDESDDEVG